MNLPLIDLAKEIKDWASAIYGREVRQATISALTKIQTQMNAAIEYISNKGTEIDNTIETVNEVKDAAEQAVTDAEAQAGNAANSAVEAAGYAAAASESATLSQSWAVGGTGMREDEDANSSKGWAEKSQNEADRASDEADRAASEADRAAQYAAVLIPDFYLDLDSGILYSSGGSGVDFQVDADTGILYWTIAKAA